VKYHALRHTEGSVRVALTGFFISPTWTKWQECPSQAGAKPVANQLKCLITFYEKGIEKAHKEAYVKGLQNIVHTVVIT
jgi:hypothetical protein